VSRTLQGLVLAVITVLLGVGVRAAEPAPGSSAPAASEPIAEVTVRAQRAQLEPRVATFVNRIAALQNEEGLPRWQAPVCPLVTGLPRNDGEFVLERISEVARAAAVPLAGEHCHANLYIFVTGHPTELLQAMEKNKRAVTFGSAAPSVVDEFITTPRPVRVWYNSQMKTPEGIDPNGGLPNAAQLLGGSLGGPPLYNDLDRTSHVQSSKIWTFSYVYLVVDQARLRGVSRGQLADYLAMVGLADIKPGAHLGDAPTILRLFEGTPDGAPVGMSDWDQAFLKSLYTTEQRLKQQRNQIANAIVREVVH
jgi:hypothetical protein